MQQAHIFYTGGKIRESAEARKIQSFELMESYHLSPMEVDQIPYQKVQEIFLLRKIKFDAHSLEVAKSEFRQQNRSTGRGGTRRGYREV